MVSASSGEGSALIASTSPSSPGHDGACTTWPAAVYRSANASQLRGVIHNPWTRRMGVLVMSFLDSCASQRPDLGSVFRYHTSHRVALARRAPRLTWRP